MAQPAVRTRNGNVVVRWDPFRDFGDLHRQFDQLVQSVAGQSQGPRASQNWRPVTDVAETETGYQVSLELPGFKRDEITISVEGDTLSVTGEYAQTEDGEQRHARRSGRFSYRTQLPKNADGDKIGASLADGVLSLSIPKTVEATPRQIEITEG